jgi:hypothetical protein
VAEETATDAFAQGYAEEVIEFAHTVHLARAAATLAAR